MTTPHEINAEVRRWVEKAENDFRNAEGESEAREAFEMVCAVRDTVRNALSSIIWN